MAKRLCLNCRRWSCFWYLCYILSSVFVLCIGIGLTEIWRLFYKALRICLHSVMYFHQILLLNEQCSVSGRWIMKCRVSSYTKYRISQNISIEFYFPSIYKFLLYIMKQERYMPRKCTKHNVRNDIRTLVLCCL